MMTEACDPEKSMNITCCTAQVDINNEAVDATVDCDAGLIDVNDCGTAAKLCRRLLSSLLCKGLVATCAGGGSL